MTALPDDVLAAVPVGQTNAMTAREIWNALSCWSVSGIRNNLDRKVADGIVCRKLSPWNGTARNVYWKEADAQDLLHV